jgi:hypothetical protein
MYILRSYRLVDCEPNEDEEFYGPFADIESANAQAGKLGFATWHERTGDFTKTVTAGLGEDWQHDQLYVAYVEALIPPG